MDSSLNKETVCRTCMIESENISSIYDYPPDNDNSRIVDILSLTVPQLRAIEPTDALPKGMCAECLTKLLSYHEFQETCIQSERQMREIFCESTEADENIEFIEIDEVGESFDEDDDDDTKGVKIKAEKEYKIKIETDASSGGLRPEIIEVPRSINRRSSIGQNRTPLKLEDESSTNHATEVTDSDESEIPKPKHQCGICLLQLSTISNLRRHERRQHGLRSKNLMAVQRSHSGRRSRPLSKAARRKLRQEKANAKANGKQEKADHVCTLCHMKFSTSSNLRRHERTQHNRKISNSNRPLKPPVDHPCDKCEKVFKNAYALREHSFVHTDERPHLCSLCGKSFKMHSTLQGHMKSHSDERNYECPHCPLRFRTSSSLSSHKVVHTRERRYICDLCGKGFVRRQVLKLHERIHTGEKPFKCEHCDMRFRVSSKMRRHMLTHTGERPCKCKYCDKAFSQSGELTKHLRVHLGENVFQCELCPRSFPTFGEKRTHFMQHKMDDEDTRERNLKAKMELEEQQLQLCKGNF